MTALKTPGNPGNARYAQFKSTRPQAGIYPLTLYYESACPLCNAEMSNLMLRNQGGQLRFADVSAPGFADVPEGATMQDLLALIHARTADGRLIKGVEVFELAYRAVGLDWISAALRLPVLRPLADWGYPFWRATATAFRAGWSACCLKAACAAPPNAPPAPAATPEPAHARGHSF